MRLFFMPIRYEIADLNQNEKQETKNETNQQTKQNKNTRLEAWCEENN